MSKEAPFETVKDAIGKVHSYDLPMMIYNLADVPDQHMYWSLGSLCNWAGSFMKLLTS